MIFWLTLTTTFLLVCVAIRAYYSKYRVQKINKRNGRNSREAVAETVVAVLNANTVEKRIIKDSIWQRIVKSLGA